MQGVEVLECVFITVGSPLAHYWLTIDSLLGAIWVDFTSAVRRLWAQLWI